MISDFSDIGHENVDVRGSTIVQNQRKVLDDRRITAYYDKNMPNSATNLNATGKFGDFGLFNRGERLQRIESPSNQKKQEMQFSQKLRNR